MDIKVYVIIWKKIRLVCTKEVSNKVESNLKALNLNGNDF